MDGLDPNWFYASVAQSAAAIVGLLGGVFATRLQDQIMRSREQRLKANEALQPLYDQLIALRMPLHEYLEHTEKQIQLLWDQLRAGVSRIEQPVRYAHVEKSSNAIVEVSGRMVRIEEERTHDAKLLLPVVAGALDGNSIAAVLQVDRGLTDLTNRVSTQTVSQVKGVRAISQRATRELRILRLRSNTRPSWILWWCLVALSIFGVVIPLWFLSAHALSHKAVLLVAFAAALIVLLVYLGSQVKDLGRSAQWRSMLPPDDPELAA
jgi:hypothetical protein